MSNTLYAYLTVLLLTLLFLLLRRYSRGSQPLEKLPLAPGPKPWPIVGNLFQVCRNLHGRLSEFAQAYGPVMSLRFGTVYVVVLSFPQAAAEILKTHDRALSARSVPPFLPFKRLALDGWSIVWATECHERWKHLRSLCHNQLFSANAVEIHSALREKKAAQMAEYLAAMEGRSVCIGEVLFTTVFNSLSNLLFSKDLLFEFEGKGETPGVRATLRTLLELATTPNIADFYPMLERFDIQGLRKKILRCTAELVGVWAADIKERRRGYAHESQSDDVLKPQQDLLDVFLANNFSTEQINVLFNDIFMAGTDATTSTVEWALTELLRNQQAIKKLRKELRTVVKQNKVRESQLSELPYLHACIKETLRLHSTVPLLVPHRAAETCEVMNYRIPKGSVLIVNAWAIGRDNSIWEEPLSFKPERFLDSNVDFKGQDYQFLPFGSGRRMCPGYPLAAKLIALLLATLVSLFDWHLPYGGNPTQVDVSEKFGITLQKEHPLLLVPKRKLL